MDFNTRIFASLAEHGHHANKPYYIHDSIYTYIIHIKCCICWLVANLLRSVDSQHNISLGKPGLELGVALVMSTKCVPRHRSLHAWVRAQSSKWHAGITTKWCLFHHGLPTRQMLRVNDPSIYLADLAHFSFWEKSRNTKHMSLCYIWYTHTILLDWIEYVIFKDQFAKIRWFLKITIFYQDDFIIFKYTHIQIVVHTMNL